MSSASITFNLNEAKPVPDSGTGRASKTTVSKPVTFNLSEAKPAVTGASAPAAPAPATPLTFQSTAVGSTPVTYTVPADLTSNPPNPATGHGEGVYHFRGPDGKELLVPYSKALALLNHPEGAVGSGQSEVDRYHQALTDLQRQGYTMAQEDIPRLYHDYAADPRLRDVRQQNFIRSIPALQTGLGFAREAARTLTFGGKHGPEAVRQFATAPQQGSYQHLGGGAEVTSELLIPEAVVGRILDGLGLAAHAPEGARAVDAASKAYSEALRTGKTVKAATAAAEEAAKTSQLAEAIPQSRKLATVVGQAALEGGRAAAEQGTQQFVKTGGDTEQAKQAAEMGGVAGGAAVLAPEIVGGAGRFGKYALRLKLSADELKGEALIKEMRDANAAVDREAERAHTANMEKIKQARDSGQTAEAARLEHTDSVERAQALATKQQNLDDALERTRASVWQRLQNMKLAARSYFRKAYQDIQEKASGVPETAGESPKQVSLSSLADDMHDALKHVSGSEKNTQTFKDIASKVKGLDKAEAVAGFTEKDLADLDPDERARLAEHLQETEGIGTGISLEDLEGYYSELGRVAASKSTPGDLKAAANAMRESIDKRIKDTYGDDTYKQVLKVRGQYREFAHGFLDTDSPIQNAIEAREHYHGTQPFLSKEGRQAAVRAGVRNTVIGDAGKESTQYYPKNIHEGYTRGEGGELVPHGEETPAWRYRRQTHSLIEHMRNLEDGLQKTKQAAAKAQTAAEKSAEALGTARQTARGTAGYRLEPVTPAAPITPARLREARAAAYTQAAHSLGKLGFWIGATGLVGGLGTFLKTGDIKKAGEGAVGGMAAGLIAPGIITAMLSRPGVVASLTQVSRQDLQNLAALPPAERADVEQTIRQLAAAAVRSNRLRAEQIPWLRILGGEAGRAASQPTATPSSASEPTTGLAMPSTPTLMPLPGERTAQPTSGASR